VLEEVADSLVGTSLGGVDLVELIGVGAASTVYGGRRTGATGATVAIKVLRADLAEAAPHRARFLREARATLRVRHDAVVTMFETSADDALPVYLVMERLDGTSLAERIEESGALGVAEARRVANRVGGALAAAHAAGVVHRDVKPANVIVEYGGRVVVVDFGLACAAGEVGVTSTGELVGTPHYMAPEQILGHAPGPAVDAYALGCMIFTMVRGSPPFSGTTGAVLDAHLEVVAPPLASGDVELDGCVAALLAKKPDRRMAAFLALVEQAHGERSAAPQGGAS